MARGDVVLFSSSSGFFDLLIKHFTKGKFTHVEIDMGDGTFVGEHANGIVRHKSGPVDGRFSLKVSAEDLAEGLAWVEEQVKAAGDPEAREYGIFSIADDALKVLGLDKVLLAKSGEWDCSEFVCLFLKAAHADAPLKVPSCTEVSPNDLARAYGVPV